jgi:hypothetical protein
MEYTEVTREVAEADFDRFARFARLKMDRKRNLIDKNDIEQDRDYLVEEIMDGRIVIDDEGHPAVICECEETPRVSFDFRPKGIVMKAMDMHKKDHDMAKVHAMIAEATRVPAAKLFALDAVDLRNVQVLFNMFLAQ